MYVRNWRKAVADHQFAGAQETRTFRHTLKHILHPMLPKTHVDAFDAMLNAMDCYITDVLEPAYNGQPMVKRAIDHYWAGRDAIFCAPIDTLPVTKNGTCVARSFIDAWLEHTGIGKGTPQYNAVLDASAAFYREAYGRSKTGRAID